MPVISLIMILMTTMMMMMTITTMDENKFANQCKSDEVLVVD